MATYDLIVIGAGPVGENVADRAAQSGLSVAVVEQELVGGSCSFWACIPSKALLRSANALQHAHTVDGAKQAITGELDVPATLERRNWFVNDWQDGGDVDWLESVGIDLYRGHGRITGERRVLVSSSDGLTELDARHAVAVCTGSASLIPDIPGMVDARPWTNREATSAQHAPSSLAIFGGGAVAAELATAYAGFGTTVTVLARSGMLGRMEPFAGEAVEHGLRALGVDIRTRVAVVGVERLADGVHLSLGDGTTIIAEELLVGAGRVPRTGDLGLESVGIKGGDWLDVDETMRVKGHDWLYAVGDANHRVLQTHQGKYQARAAGDVIAARAKGRHVDDLPWGTHVATADHAAVPHVVFSDPQVAAVGLTADQARKAGKRVRVIDYDLSSVSGAELHADGYAGQARMVVDEDREVVLGVTLVGREVAELLHAATIAVVGEVPIHRLWHAVPSFPTMSELWLRLLEGYGRP